MGPTLGKLPENLRALGVAPEQIGTIFLTHLHPDHANGLVDDAGRAASIPMPSSSCTRPKRGSGSTATIASAPNDRIRRNIANARMSTGPYRARLRTVADGEAAPGVSAVLMPGHTPGHTGWLIQSGNDGLLVWGDLVHLAAVQVARPDTGLVYDVDPQTACATRKRMFDRVAADKLKVAGAHLDFPGFGTIARKGAGFAFEPDA